MEASFSVEKYMSTSMCLSHASILLTCSEISSTYIFASIFKNSFVLSHQSYILQFFKENPPFMIQKKKTAAAAAV